MKTTEDTLQIFHEHGVDLGKVIRIYGQYHPTTIPKKYVKSIRLHTTSGATLKPRISIYNRRHDFFLEIPVESSSQAFRVSMNNKTIFTEVHFSSPFRSLGCSDSAAIIATMVKNFEHRLFEWLDYHLAIGFSRIILYDNGSTDQTLQRIAELNDPRIVTIPFHYAHFADQTFADTQRIALSTAITAYRKYCGWVCLIDADEFIQIPGMNPMNIEIFLSAKRFRSRRAVTMPSILLTNKGNNDPIKNNILELCRFSNNEPKYTKMFINARKSHKIDFIKNPHRLRGQTQLKKTELYHGHFWCNDRLTYHSDFVEHPEFLTFKQQIINQ